MKSRINVENSWRRQLSTFTWMSPRCVVRLTNDPDCRTPQTRNSLKLTLCIGAYASKNCQITNRPCPSARGLRLAAQSIKLMLRARAERVQARRKPIRGGE